MTQQIRVPTRSLVFMANTARYGAKLGLKKGIFKAGSKISPPLLVIEAAVSVVDAVNSYMELRQARIIKEGLDTTVPLLEEELKVHRQALEEQIETARQALAQKKKVTEVFANLVQATQQSFSLSMNSLLEIRKTDIPDLEAFDEKREELEDAWYQFLGALELYQKNQ